MANIINSSDIYNISSFVNDIQSKYMNTPNETMFMGMFGYLNEMFSTELQNNIISMSEYANEAFPIRSKFEKSILTYAMMYDVKNINATPAVMNVLLGFDRNILDKNLDAENKFILDKDIPIYIGDYCFHLDYDIQIEKIKLNNKTIDEYIYTARYLMDIENPVSDITNPYLQAPINMITYDNDNTRIDFICIDCIIRQVTTSTITTKIVTNNIFDNKTVDFEFDDQMVCFEVVVNKAKDGSTLRLRPYFEGVSINKEENYCLYSYLDSKTIRIKFPKESYEPMVNDEILIKSQVTNGSEGNIEYSDNIVIPLKSDRYNYISSSYMVVQPATNEVGRYVAQHGNDRKTLDDLKRIIPKEILARGTIITNKDLNNYFNEIDSGKIEFCKKIDNQIQRLYYAYLLVKDANNNVIPTNTLTMSIDEKVFRDPTANRLCIDPGMVARYSNGGCSITSLQNISTSAALKEEESNFVYTSPYNIIIDRSPLRVSYYMTNVDNEVKMEYTFINNSAKYQFICNSLRCRKNYLINNNRNYYTLTFSITQNILQNINLISENNGLINHLESSIRLMLVVEDTNGRKYYKEGYLSTVALGSTPSDKYTYNCFFELECDQSINENNTVTIYNMKRVVKNEGIYTLDVQDIELNEHTKMYIYTFIDKTLLNEDSENPSDLYDVIYEYDDNTIITKDDLYNDSREYSHVRRKLRDTDGNELFILTNIYTTFNDINLFYNFSDSIRSTVEYRRINGVNLYTINSVPLVRYSYINDPENMDRYNYLFKHIQNRKFFMDIALTELEESFDFDLKFFNTYGPSKLFRVGRKDQLLNRVNLTMKFVVKLFAGINNSIVKNLKDDIKTYVENINENTDDIHMSNLITQLLEKYSDSVKYIEFVDINNMGAYIQYLQKKDLQELDDVPEFLNINLLDNVEPDIQIELV